MKRILSIIAILAFSATAFGQTYIYPTAKDFKGYLTTATADTLTDATTKTWVIALTGAKDAVSWSVDVLRVSGTAAGYIQYFGSANDTTYFTTPFHVDTLTNVAAQVSGYSYLGNPYAKVKVKMTQSGTVKTNIRLGGTWREAK